LLAFGWCFLKIWVLKKKSNKKLPGLLGRGWKVGKTKYWYSFSVFPTNGLSPAKKFTNVTSKIFLDLHGPKKHQILPRKSPKKRQNKLSRQICHLRHEGTGKDDLVRKNF